MATTTIPAAEVGTRIEVTILGRLPYRVREYAIAKMASVIRAAAREVVAVRVKISRAHHRYPDEWVVVEINAEARGRSVRVQVTAGSGHEAIDLAQERLRRKLSDLARPPAVSTVDEAIFDMERMDYDFRLFVDALSGVDSVVYRDAAYGYRVTRLDGNAAPTNSISKVLIDARGAQWLTLDRAADVINATNIDFVFFADPGTGRGNVLYRRHDGHYGLVTPAG